MILTYSVFCALYIKIQTSSSSTALARPSPKSTNYLNNTTNTLPNLVDLLSKAEQTLADNQDSQSVINWANQQLKTQNFDPLQLNDAPIPLNTWLKQMSTAYWAINFKQALVAINQSWQSIYNNYKNNIKQHFPFALAVNANVSLDNFNNLFSAKGQLISFINNNLNNLINKSQPTWSWNKIPGLTPSKKFPETIRKC